jgi:hypothetical protein
MSYIYLYPFAMRYTMVTIRHSKRDGHSKWAFGELRNFIEYKPKKEDRRIDNTSIE